MRKILLPILFIVLLPLTYSCGSSRLAGYSLNERDAIAAIRQMLEFGARDNVSGAFSKEAILSTLFPEKVKNALNTLNQLGLTSEVDRFTTTLSTAAEKSATASIPIFVNSINNMKFTDAKTKKRSGKGTINGP